MDFFEIDHFKPQSLNLPDTHKYHNLYYSCEKCNNEKSDIWDTKLLDPCTDDIFSGINPAIIGGKKRRIIINILPKTIEEHFILIPLNLIPEHKSVSGKQEKIMKTAYTINTLIDEILLKFQYNAELHDLKDLIYQLDNLRHLKQQRAWQAA